MHKFSLMFAFSQWCPSVIICDGKIYCPKPTYVSMVEAGTTKGPFSLPIYELHNDGGPSVTFLGKHDYHWHNMRIPERMGSIKSTKWRSEWILDEENSEVRRVLLEQIGSERVLSELNFKKLDGWREYELFRLETTDEPIQLLKMICPSTGSVYVEGVPPDIETCEQARNWQFGDDVQIEKYSFFWEA